MITSPKNNQIKDAQKLQRKHHRDSQKLLLIEGVRLLGDALQSSVLPKRLFYMPEITAQNPQAEYLVKQLIALDVECLPCTPAAMAPLTSTVTPQGLVGVLPLPENRIVSHASLILILDQVRDPGNAGTLLRSAEAAGVEQVFFAPDTVDPFNDKVIRAAMGAHFRLPIAVCEHWPQLQAYCRQLTSETLPIYLAAANGEIPYDAVPWPQPAVLIVGGEADGASAEALAWATPISIPMAGGTESLNAAIAGSVILFEAARQRRQP